MMQRKPQSYLGLDTNMEDMGAGFLQSGFVSPEEVQAASDMVGAGGFDMSAPPATPGAKPPQTKKETRTTKDKKMSETKTTFLAPDEFSQLAMTLDPYMKDMQKGIDEQESMIAMAQNRPAANDYWVRPLLSLADAQTGSNMAKDFRPGPTQPEIDAQVMGLRSKLQDDKRDMSKALLDGITKLKAGSKTNSEGLQSSQIMALMSGMNNSFADRQGLADDKNANIMHRQVVAAIKNNKPLATQVSQYQNLGAALNVLANADTVTPQQLHEAQQAIRSNIGIKGTGGVDERKETYYTSLGLNAANWMQFLTSEPQDIKKDRKLLEHVKQLAGLEMANIDDLKNSKLEMIGGGADFVYDDPKYADLKKSRDNLIKSYGAQFKIPDAKTVKEKGDKIAGVNHSEPKAPPDFSTMSIEELKAYTGK